jgi:ligand-binding SRPBCC domain-containing protein
MKTGNWMPFFHRESNPTAKKSLIKLKNNSIMPIHHLERKQILYTTPEKAWEFFSRPNNLKTITPDFMGFHILSVSGRDELHEGQIIKYKVKPFSGIPVRWVTEINHVDEPWFFVDEQKSGPFLFWHHKHYIEKLADGTVLMTDSVHYRVYYGLIGAFINKFFVRPRLETIFDYRRKVISKIFAPENFDSQTGNVRETFKGAEI